MADPVKTELITQSTMTGDSMSPTVSTLIRNEQSITCTGTAFRDTIFQGIRKMKTGSCILLSRLRKLFIRNDMMISAKRSMSGTGRPGHSNRDRLTEDLWKDKKTCPEESLIQIGTIEQSVSPAVLAEIAAEFFEEFERRFGKHIHILDWSLHLDETTPHIHERHVFDCENRYGEIAPQQEKALEALGFDLPNPDQKPGKLNNRKKTFDAACRAMLFEICKRHGLHLDQEPEYGGRAYLEKQDYILMKQKERMAAQERKMEAKEEELEAISIRIEDTEAFVEEVADAAYEKAVEAVADKVREETRNEDFEIIEGTREQLFRSYHFTPDGAQIINSVFSDIMDRFKGMTQYISDRVAAIFRSPQKKAEIKEPIKESIRDRLARNQRRADEANARRRAERGVQPKRKQQNKDLW